MADLSTTLSVQNFSGWAYDATRNDLDVVTSDGHVLGWNVERQAFDFWTDVPGQPGSVAVSQDGHYLVVGDYNPITTSAPFAVTPTYAGQVTRVDLTNLSQLNVQHALPDHEIGVRDVAVDAGGHVLITGDYNASGWEPLRSFDVNQPGAVTTVSSIGSPGLPDNSHLIVSEHANLVLVEEGNSYPAVTYLLNGTNDQLLGKDNPWTLYTDEEWGGSAVSEARGMVVDVAGNKGIHTFDLQMHPLADLGSYGANGTITANAAISAAAFSPDGSRIYLWQGEQSHVFVLDSTTYQTIGSIEVTSTIGAPSYSSAYSMQVVDNGRLLVLDTGSSLDVVDLSARTNTQVAAETLSGSASADTFVGGSGDDSLSGGDGDNHLSGGYGNDTLVAGVGADAINGNQGNDSIRGGDGADSLMGGKGADQLFGEAGADSTNGNIGDDTVDGGAGADTLYGGQGNDSVFGGDGNDWLSGDRGTDTLAGGAGADTFHTSLSASIDRVIDFNASEGDRIQLDHGLIYSVSQYNADTVISISGGQATMTLVNVQLSALPSGWLFEA